MNMLLAHLALGCLATAGLAQPAAPVPPAQATELAQLQARRVHSGSPSIGRAIRQSWGPQRAYFIRNDFELISWHEAQARLLAGHTLRGKQYHTGWLVLHEPTGGRFLVLPPSIDAVFAFIHEHRLEQAGIGTE